MKLLKKMQNKIFIHGLISSGDGFKGQLLREILPGCLSPTFSPYNSNKPIALLFKERMDQLVPILEEKIEWLIIGSSFGGLMATVYTLEHPYKVSKLILLAPYLSTPILNPKIYSPIDVPVIVFHGKYDEIVSVDRTKKIAENLFINLRYSIVDDDHTLKKTVKKLNWKDIIKN
ncbi:MAG: alpha/beta hydrolase [Promethearchaeota archaeon]